MTPELPGSDETQAKLPEDVRAKIDAAHEAYSMGTYGDKGPEVDPVVRDVTDALTAAYDRIGKLEALCAKWCAKYWNALGNPEAAESQVAALRELLGDAEPRLREPSTEIRKRIINALSSSPPPGTGGAVRDALVLAEKALAARQMAERSDQTSDAAYDKARDAASALEVKALAAIRSALAQPATPEQKKVTT